MYYRSISNRFTYLVGIINCYYAHYQLVNNIFITFSFASKLTLTMKQQLSSSYLPLRSIASKKSLSKRIVLDLHLRHLHMTPYENSKILS